MRRELVPILGVMTAGTLLLAGCSTSGRDVSASRPAPVTTSGPAPSGPTGFPSTSSTPTPAPTATTPTSTTPTPTTGTTRGASGPVDLPAALLATSDLPGYTRSLTVSSSSPLPCTPSAKPPATIYKPTRKAGVRFVNGTRTVQVEETILVYGTEAGAERFAAAAAAGFSCRTGEFGGGTKGSITSVGRIPTGVPTDSALRWDIAFQDGTLGTAVLVRSGSEVIGLTFEATKQSATQLYPGAVALKAVARLDAAR